MPHKDDLKCEERPVRGARQRGMGQGRRQEDSTGSAARNRPVSSTPEGRKSPTSLLDFAAHVARLRARLEADLLAENDQDELARAWGER